MTEINNKSTANQQQIIDTQKTVIMNLFYFFINIGLFFIETFAILIFISFFGTIYTYINPSPPIAVNVIDCALEINRKLCETNFLTEYIHRVFLTGFILTFIFNVVYYIIYKKTTFVRFKYYYES